MGWHGYIEGALNLRLTFPSGREFAPDGQISRAVIIESRVDVGHFECHDHSGRVILLHSDRK